MPKVQTKCKACGNRYYGKFSEHEETCHVLRELRSKSKPVQSLVRKVSEEEFKSMEAESGRNCCSGVVASHCPKSKFGKWYGERE